MATPLISNISTVLTSTPMKWALGGWSFFILENFIVSENRCYLISNFGDDAYHIAYGTLSTAAMTSVFYGYFKRAKDAPPYLWMGGSVPLSAKFASFICLSLGLGIASQIPPKLQLPIHYFGGDEPVAKNDHLFIGESDKKSVGGVWKVRCPFDFTDKKNKDNNSTLYGLDRVSRHPGLWSFGLVGVGSAALVPSLPQRVWLSMPILVALLGGAHTDSRHRRGMGGELLEEYDSITSNIPFLAMVSNKQGASLDVFREFFTKEVKLLNAALAVGVAGVVVLTKGRTLGNIHIR